MEVVVWGAVTTIWWLSSATVLLPFLLILKYNKYFRDRWFSIIFTSYLNVLFEPTLAPFRKKSFQLLKESLAKRDVSKPLKVLEIGIGSGANLQYYPENCKLTALDMNATFESYFIKNQKKFPQIVYEKTIISMAENMKDVEDSSMDLVVSTYVLCSVTSVTDVLKEIKRVLKPEGKFLFLEHVSHPESEWGYTLQRFASPLWCIYCDGCNLLRNIGDDIKNAGFSDVNSQKMLPNSLHLLVRPHVYGLATK